MNKIISKALLIGISLIGCTIGSDLPANWDTMTMKQKIAYNEARMEQPEQTQAKKVEQPKVGKLGNVWNPQNEYVKEKKPSNNDVYYDPNETGELGCVSYTASNYGIQVKKELSHEERKVFDNFIGNPVQNVLKFESFLKLVEAYVIPKKPAIIEEVNSCILALDTVFDRADFFFKESSWLLLDQNPFYKKLEKVRSDLKKHL